MPAAAFHTLGNIRLPRGMRWVDEFSDWAKVARETEYGITGALIVDVGVRQAGRPITLAAREDQGFIRRDVLLQLHALTEAHPDAVHVLTLADGRTFNVIFADGDASVTATPVGLWEVPADHHPYVATLRLLTA